MKSFSFAKYGDVVAPGVALYFCERMEHFFHIWMTSGVEDYEFSESDVERAPLPSEDLQSLRVCVNERHVRASLDELMRLAPSKPAR